MLLTGRNDNACVTVLSAETGDTLATIVFEGGEFSKSVEEVIMMTCSLMEQDVDPSQFYLKDSTKQPMMTVEVVPKGSVVHLCRYESPLFTCTVDFGDGMLATVSRRYADAPTRKEVVQKGCAIAKQEPEEWSCEMPYDICARNEYVKAVRRRSPKRQKLEANHYAMFLVEDFVRNDPSRTCEMRQKEVPESTQYALVLNQRGERSENVLHRHCTMLGLDHEQYVIENALGKAVDVVLPMKTYFLTKKSF